ncbi:DUF3492 domain-containing protein [bacterium M00.F.Ca.ET.228.01.1.1]|uniref:GT4 family glycosyltransferase PelF n=1 Tax=Paraburkholderia phenoliruptrix TaxID=252970 RepID=UPI001091CE24|nr:GT4 family glycosyltransferase PelF [Paraburkholderia phenoliruptrix]TGP39508.1 DUF3492 domain-containing protein [bacterium M00.F.Ca.ET.228.01.1.1]TGR95239.1 DUF3492 domain-containing protein [bacterium M00.F.Ca.ET.191.01.1.1]TGT96069.1 DUF3492 domain-containing protein [bacterium M00.F.Ca.ET.155.01.1.1]MBW0446153.1 GT4 family glycosyltransferase PelF [Paraburkholderia phenoliruptrix]MBW9096576.1 GT4 family glycosyltransferase PelF [Paraburkholderia phenoliruptrix]
MIRELPNRKAADADVCLLLEGTYPFVRGGVSSWVNEMIRAFAQTRFAIVFIGSRKEDYSGVAYALPDNVVHIETHFLYEQPMVDSAPPHAFAGDAAAFAHSRQLHDAWRNPGQNADVGALMVGMMPMLGDGAALNEKQFVSSRAAWDTIVDQYHKYCTDPSFTDYFWTVRIMHGPLWQLARVSEKLLPARVYHSVSTGYGGFLGALMHYRTGRPLLVSEHGIYTKERKIDLLQGSWIRDNRGVLERDVSSVSYFRELWVRFFEAIGKLAYNAADDIVALYEANRQRQIADGAQPDRTQCIPNGIDVDALEPLIAERKPREHCVVALIGRVVPIKDIKNFIRAMFIASRTMPDLEAWIVGPEEEDPEYALECRALVENLQLARNVKFLGFQRIADVLPQIDLVAISSISEALPLVVLEGFAAGVPAITTDVGSCRQLIEGSDDEDRALGSAGMVVQIADPAGFAEAVLSMLTDTTRWQAAQKSGLARVRRYYTRAQMIERYRTLYERLAATPDRQGSAFSSGAMNCPIGHHKASGEARSGAVQRSLLKETR